jgi:DHA2 family multidrug resistance protein
LLPTLSRTAFSTLDPILRPEGTALFNLSRLYGSTIGIAVVLTFFYDNTQAMHVALAKDLTPYRAAARVASSIAVPGLAALNDMVTGQAAFVGVINQFEVMRALLCCFSVRRRRRSDHRSGRYAHSVGLSAAATSSRQGLRSG